MRTKVSSSWSSLGGGSRTPTPVRSPVGTTCQSTTTLTYTLVVQATRRPRYFDAAVVPRRPFKFDKPLLRAGRHRWALGVTMAPRMNLHRHWNLGVKIGGVMYLVPVRVIGG